LKLKNNHLINIGESFLVVNIIDKSGDSELQQSNLNFSNLSQFEKNNLQLRLKIFGVINNGETLYDIKYNR